MFHGSEFTKAVSDAVSYTAYGACDALSAAMPELGLVSRDFEQALYAYAKRHNLTYGIEVMSCAREIVQEIVCQRRNQVAAENVAKLNARRTA